MHLAREDADDDAGEQPFDGRADDDADDPVPHFGGKPRRQPVEDTEKAAEQRGEQYCVHESLSSVIYYTRPSAAFKLKSILMHRLAAVAALAAACVACGRVADEPRR